MVGRDHERRLLGGLVESLTVGGGAVVIHGEPGMGKTSLLGFVADCAKRHDARVLTARGIESEAVLPFAAITDLLWPLREHFATLPAIQREALEVCLALSAGPPRGPLAACAGALRCPCCRRRSSPLVILVDDFQWLDAESAQILLFVARRLAVERLAMVFAVLGRTQHSPSGNRLAGLVASGVINRGVRATRKRDARHAQATSVGVIG